MNDLELLEQVNESEYESFVETIKQEIEDIDINIYKLKVSAEPELLAKSLDMLIELLKPRLKEVNGSQDQDKILPDKLSKALNDHYDCQEIHAHLFGMKIICNEKN